MQRSAAPVPLLFVALAAAACDSLPSFDPRPRRPSHPRAEAHVPPERGYDVEHYALDVELLPAERAIEGTCRIRLASNVPRLETVELDLVGLEVHGVADGPGNDLAFSRRGGTLSISLAEPLDLGSATELAVRYGGSPVDGLWFTGRREDGSGPTRVFSQGETEHNRGWFPCFDHPSDRATSEVRVTMPAGWTSFAPGERIDAVDGATSRTEHWRMSTPHPSYLVGLVAGELAVRDASWRGVPLQFAAEPVDARWLEATFHETEDALDFLTAYTGVRYPFARYGQAAISGPPWGGREGATTPFALGGERAHRDRPAAEPVARDAARQWFGVLLGCRDWAHLWLNEGFASYMTLLFFEETRGVDEFRARVRDAQERYLEDRGSARLPTVWNVCKDPDDLFDTRVVEGAAIRLHLLRHLVGDDAFRDGVRAYVAGNAGRSVVTADLRDAMESASGLDLETFFAQWILGSGHPEFDLSWSWDERDRLVTLDVRQVQAARDGTPGVFRVPVEVEVRDRAGTRLHRIELTERRQEFELPADVRPLYVLFDKHGWIPKTVEWERPALEWLAIASGDDDVNGRRDAVRALGRLAEEARERGRRQNHGTCTVELTDRLRRDTSPWVRAEAAEALGRARGPEARRALMDAATGDPRASVRVAALEALGRWGEGLELARFADTAFDEGFSWATMGAAAGLYCAADPPGAYRWITARLLVDSPQDRLCALLLEHLAGLGNAGVGEQLRRWASDPAVDPGARAVALRELVGLTREVSRNSRFVAEFLGDESFHLRQAAVEALAEMDDEIARRALRGYYPRARTPRERRVIEAALAGRDPLIR